jgi:hypothetical protein
VRWVESGNKEAVVTPGVQSDNGRASEAANAVGFEPFAIYCLVEITAYFFSDEDVHDQSPNQHWGVWVWKHKHEI